MSLDVTSQVAFGDLDVMAPVPIELDLVFEQVPQTDIDYLPYYQCLFSPYVLSELLPQPLQPFFVPPTVAACDDSIDDKLVHKSLHNLVDNSVYLTSAAEGPFLRSLQTIFYDLTTADVEHATPFIPSALDIHDNNYAQTGHTSPITFSVSPSKSTGYAFIPRVEHTRTTYSSHPILRQQQPCTSSSGKRMGTSAMEKDGNDAKSCGCDAAGCYISEAIPPETVHRPWTSCTFPDPVYIPPTRITSWLAASLGLYETVSSLANSGMGIPNRCRSRTHNPNHAAHIISRASTWLHHLHTHLRFKHQDDRTCTSENGLSGDTTTNTNAGTATVAPCAHSHASGQMANTDRYVKKKTSTHIQLNFPYSTENLPGKSGILCPDHNFPTLSHVSGDLSPDIGKHLPTSHDLRTFLSHASHIAIYQCSTHASPPLHPITWMLCALSIAIANITLTTEQIRYTVEKNSSLPAAGVGVRDNEDGAGSPRFSPSFVILYMRHVSQLLQSAFNALYPTSESHVSGTRAINNAKIRVYVDSSTISLSISLNMQDHGKRNAICIPSNQRIYGGSIYSPTSVSTTSAAFPPVSVPLSVPFSPPVSGPLSPQPSQMLPSPPALSTADPVATHVGDINRGACAKSFYLECIRHYLSIHSCGRETSSINNAISHKHAHERGIEGHIQDMIRDIGGPSSPTFLDRLWQGVAEREVEREESQYQRVLAEEVRVAMEQREILLRERTRQLCRDSDGDSDSETSSEDNSSDSDHDSGSDVESDGDAESDIDCEGSESIHNTIQYSNACTGNDKDGSPQSPLTVSGRVPGATPNWGQDIPVCNPYSSSSRTSTCSRAQTDCTDLGVCLSHCEGVVDNSDSTLATMSNTMLSVASVCPEDGCLAHGLHAGREVREYAGAIIPHICENTPDSCLHGSVAWVSDATRPCFYKETQDIMPTTDDNTQPNTDNSTTNSPSTSSPAMVTGKTTNTIPTTHKDNDEVLVPRGWEAWGAHMLKAHWRYITRIMPWSPQFQKETPDAASRYLPSSLRYFKVLHPASPLFSLKPRFRVGSPVPFPSVLTPKTLSFPSILSPTSGFDTGGANPGAGISTNSSTCPHQEVGRQRMGGQEIEKGAPGGGVLVHLHPHTWLHPQFVAASAAIPQAPKLLWWLTGALSRACIRATPGQLTGDHAFTRVPLAEYGYEPGCDFASSFPTIASPYRTAVGLLAALHTLHDTQAVGSLGVPHPANLLVWMAALAHIIQVGLTYTIETVFFDESGDEYPEYANPKRKEDKVDDPELRIRDAYGLYPHSSRQACALIAWFMLEHGLIKTKAPVLALAPASISTPVPAQTTLPVAGCVPVRISPSASAISSATGLLQSFGLDLSQDYSESDHVSRYAQIQASRDTTGTSQAPCGEYCAYPHAGCTPHGDCHYWHGRADTGICASMSRSKMHGDACRRWEAFARVWLHRAQSKIQRCIMTHVCVDTHSQQSSSLTTSTDTSVSPSRVNRTTAHYHSLVHAALRQHHESWMVVATAVVDTVVCAIGDNDMCLPRNIDTRTSTNTDINMAPLGNFLIGIGNDDADTRESSPILHSTHLANAHSPPRHSLPTDSQGAPLSVLTSPQLGEVWYLSASPVDTRLALARLASQMRVAEALGYKDDVLGAWTLLNEGWRAKAHEWGRAVLMRFGVLSSDDNGWKQERERKGVTLH